MFRIMFKKAFDIAVAAVRVGVVLVAILSLTVTGASAAERLFLEQNPAEVTPPEPAENGTIEATADPSESPDGMATGGRPWTEQAGYLQRVLALPGGNNHYRPLRNFHSWQIAAIANTQSGTWAKVTPRAGEVSSQLSHRFTLVGSIPSGTS